MVHALKRKESGLRLLMAGVAALALSGCSDSSRLDDPFSSPFKTSARYDRAPTGAINAPEKKDLFAETFRGFDDPAPTNDSSVDLRRSGSPRPIAPLSVQSRPPTPPAQITSSPLPAPRAIVATPALSPRPTPPAPIQFAAPRSVPARVGGWSIEGGAPVEVAQGETAGMIANRYGVPTETLLQLNGYRNAAQVRPGARLTIPVYSASHAAAKTEAPAPRQASAAPQSAASRDAEVAPAPKKLEPRYALKPGPKSQVEEENADEAKAAVTPKIDAAAQRKAKLAEARAAAIKEAAAQIDKKKAQESIATAKAATDAVKAEKLAQKAQARAQQQAQAAAVEAAPKMVQAEPVKPAPEPARPGFVKQQATSAPEDDATARTTPAGDSANPEFRWPARGRVIQGYGNSGNDGINISVPEGTAVKAAESGVVTYAGSELKGYGNLVLIHHPNGFDSVYANNGSLNVKRGDTVKRGQTVALSGQSGNVSSPQLHFELRKGHKPVDPTGFLAGL